MTRAELKRNAREKLGGKLFPSLGFSTITFGSNKIPLLL